MKKIIKENKAILEKLAKKLYKKEDLNLTELKGVLTLATSSEV